MAFTRLDLESKIKEFFDLETISPLINNQITKLVRERKYGYKDIARALYFWRFEKGQTLDSRGIAIVPYIMEESNKFFQERARKEKEQLEAIEKKQQEAPHTILCIKPKRRKKKSKFIDISLIKDSDSEDGR